MTDAEKLELLDWIGEQTRLRIEEWHYSGGRVQVSVWTIFDEEDNPSGKAPTVIEALLMAKRESDLDD